MPRLGVCGWTGCCPACLESSLIFLLLVPYCCFIVVLLLFCCCLLEGDNKGDERAWQGECFGYVSVTSRLRLGQELVLCHCNVVVRCKSVTARLCRLACPRTSLKCSCPQAMRAVRAGISDISAITSDFGTKVTKRNRITKLYYVNLS